MFRRRTYKRRSGVKSRISRAKPTGKSPVKMWINYISWLILIDVCCCQNDWNQTKIDLWFDEVEKMIGNYNALAATLSWELAVNNNGSFAEEALALGRDDAAWKNSVCKIMQALRLNEEKRRKYYLLCRGPRILPEELEEFALLSDAMSQSYVETKICFGPNLTVIQGNWTADRISRCYGIEPDLERMMTMPDMGYEQLLRTWQSWHDAIGPKIKRYYPRLVELQNRAARRNGYSDIGAAWRDELETNDLEANAFALNSQISHLYTMLHAIVRHKLYQKYGRNKIDPSGPIPAHLLGHMFAQDWGALLRMFEENGTDFDWDRCFMKKNWTTVEMVLLAEDMFTSLGLPKMTDKFWKKSKFEKGSENDHCHGTAASMYQEGDYRMVVCADANIDDFYVIHHEMGHIEYYMSYEKQSPIYQAGANSAFHESVGDAIFAGVLSPQNLHRLGLIGDADIADERFHVSLLLWIALRKIPSISYGLLLDKHRWDIFRGYVRPEDYNRAFWELSTRLRGIAPPGGARHGEDLFDAAAKFHVPDNTPYIRYFLSGFLEMELFEALCKWTIFETVRSDFEKSPLQLYNCDIYGSRAAGRKLREMMAKGASEHWSKSLKILTGRDTITAEPLLNFFKPLEPFLKDYIERHKVPIGW